MKVGFILSTAVALSCLGATSAAAQDFTVSGYVRDAENGEALMGAVVAETDGAGGTSANQAGFWSIRLPAGRRNLSASHIGYDGKDWSIEIASDTILNFQLDRTIITLDEIVVKPANEQFSVKGSGQIGVNITQVRNAPAFLGEPDIIKYLQIMPGVSSGREGSSQLLVRGGGADETLMMLDDIPIFNNNHAFGLVSVFNADAMSGAELYKGYVPARYGGRLSSVASLRMRDGNRNRHSQSLTVGTLTVGGLAEGPINKGKGSYIVSARMFTPDWLFLRPAYAIKKMNNEVLFSFYDVNAKINYAFGQRNRLYLSFYNGGDSFSFKGIEYKYDRYIQDDWIGHPDEKSKRKSSESGAGMRWGNTSASIKLETQAGKDIFISNSVYFSRIGNMTKSFYEDFDESIKSTTRNRSNLFETGLRTSVEQKTGRRHNFTYGLHLYYQGFTPMNTTRIKDGASLESSLPDRGLWTGSLFADDHISLGAVSVDVGVRVSAFYNISKLRYGIEPRAGMNWQVNSANSATLSYTRSVQPLFSVVRPYLGFPLDYWLPFDGEKLPTANQISAGWTNRTVKGLTLNIEAYYKRFSNLSLVFSPDDYMARESEALPGKGYAYGVEFMGLYSVGRWSLSGSYAYARSMRQALGQTFPFDYDTPHNGNLYASYITVRKADRTHTLSLNMNSHSGLPFVLSQGAYPDVDGDPMYQNPIFPNARIKPYFRTDVSYAMERRKRNGTRTWQISILNVTNTKNPYVVYKSNKGYKYSTLIPIMPSFSYKRTF